MKFLNRTWFVIMATGLFLVLVGGCATQQDPFLSLVKQDFFAYSPGGDLTEVRGKPDRIVEYKEKVKIRMETDDGYQYLDPLALESGLLGEHPSDKLYRLEKMGIPMSIHLSDDLFHTLYFEYLPGKEISGIIAEVFPDGTLLVIPDEVPPEWRTNELGATGPSLFHVDPRALITKTSRFAKEYESEVFSLPLEQWRDPPISAMFNACALYKESIMSEEYRTVLFSVGYSLASPPVSLQDVLQRDMGEEKRYFGFDEYWMANRIRQLGISQIGECDTVSGVRDFYFFVRPFPEQDGSRETHIVRVDRKKSGEVVFCRSRDNHYGSSASRR